MMAGDFTATGGKEEGGGGGDGPGGRPGAVGERGPGNRENEPSEDTAPVLDRHQREAM